MHFVSQMSAPIVTLLVVRACAHLKPISTIPLILYVSYFVDHRVTERTRVSELESSLALYVSFDGATVTSCFNSTFLHGLQNCKTAILITRPLSFAAIPSTDPAINNSISNYVEVLAWGD
jgi:hypothetical protein